MRTINADLLIKYLASRQKEFIDDYGKGWSAGISSAISICEKFSKLEKSAWKSRDEAPEKNDIYCVYVQAHKAPSKKKISYARYRNGRWLDLYDDWENKCWDVTHWMPQPEPPEKG